MSKLLDRIKADRRKRARRLMDIEVEEISIVDKAANRLSFVITKVEDDPTNESGPEKLAAILAPLVADRGANPMTLEAAMEEFKLYSNDLPDAVRDAVGTLAAALVEAIAGPDGERSKGGDRLSNLLAPLVANRSENSMSIEAAAKVLFDYVPEYPDGLKAAIAALAFALVEATNAAPADDELEKIPGVVTDVLGGRTLIKSEGAWPSLGPLAAAMINLSNPKLGARLMEKRRERGEDDGAAIAIAERDEAINELLAENERLRSAQGRRGGSSQQRSAEFFEATAAAAAIEKAADPDDIENRWPSLSSK
jgi:hypothetical protein